MTVTVSGDELAFASVTTSEKTSVTGRDPLATAGAVKVGPADGEEESATAGPAVCVQAYVMAWPSGSWLPLPSSVTAAPDATA